MKEPAGRLSSTRRTFLKAAVAVSGAGALNTVQASPADLMTHSEVEADDVSADRSQGYHETAHIRDYYKTLRE